MINLLQVYEEVEMLRIVKIELVCCAFFIFECHSMNQMFSRTITEHAINKQYLFDRLQAIHDGEDGSLASEYLTLYGDHVLEGEERRRTFSSIVPFERNKIIAAATYVVKALFGQAKKELYGVDMLNECVRVAELLLSDAPQLASDRPMNNIGDMLQAARHMLQARNNVADEIKRIQHDAVEQPQVVGFAAAR